MFTSPRRAIEEHVGQSVLLDEGPDKSKILWGMLYRKATFPLWTNLMVEMMSSWLISSCSPLGRYFSTQGRFVPLVVLHACSSTSGILAADFWNTETCFWRFQASTKRICRVWLQTYFVSVLTEAAKNPTLYCHWYMAVSINFVSPLFYDPFQKMFIRFWRRRDQTSQELRMVSSVTINCQTTKIVMNSGSQLSEL